MITMDNRQRKCAGKILFCIFEILRTDFEIFSPSLPLENLKISYVLVFQEELWTHRYPMLPRKLSLVSFLPFRNQNLKFPKASTFYSLKSYEMYHHLSRYALCVP